MIENFIRNYEYYKDVNLKKYNTYKLDCTADYLVYPSTVLELTNFITFLKGYCIKYIILGGGSNVILARPHFSVVIKLDRLNNVTVEGNIVKAEAGVSLIKLANICMNNNLYGLAFAGGIPGLVGASTAMNAGAYNEDMSMIVKEVKVLDKELELITLTNKELEYSYRDSFLKRNKEYIVIETTFKMKHKDKEEIRKIMDDRRERRITTQPINRPTAGSVFRNPPGDSAGRLIEEAGLKGYSHGGALVSRKHANFIVNNNDATYEDIIMLIDYIRERIKILYDIDLILEQEIIR